MRLPYQPRTSEKATSRRGLNGSLGGTIGEANINKASVAELIPFNVTVPPTIQLEPTQDSPQRGTTPGETVGSYPTLQRNKAQHVNQCADTAEISTPTLVLTHAV